MGERVLPTVQALSLSEKHNASREVGSQTEEPRQTRTIKSKNMIRESGGRILWCSSSRVLVQPTESAEWYVVANDSHGVEISIAAGVRKMVRDPNPIAGECPHIGVLPSTLTLYDSYSMSHDS